MTYTQIQWGIIFFFALLVSLWVQFSSLHVIYNKESIYLYIFLSSFLFLLYSLYAKFRPIPEIVVLLQCLFVFQFYTPIMVVLSYLAVTANQPFIDPALAYIDNYLGVNSSLIVLWFRSHEVLHNIFYFIYQTYYYLWVGVVFYFTYYGKSLHLQRFLTQFMIAASLTSVISTFFPAEGPFVWYHYTPNEILGSALRHVHELRHQILNITEVNGVTIFPSFHTIMALIYAYCFRFERKIIFIPILILNMLIIFACLPIGEHYFADILVAIPVFGVVIWLEKLIFKNFFETCNE